MRRPWILALVLAALGAPLAAQPHLVEDLNTAQLLNSANIFMGYPGGSAVDRGIFYFAASDPAHGLELWRTDGTEAGTWRVADVCPGPCDSSPTELAVFHGHLYFSADDGVSGRELWQVDGTAGSEQQVHDLCPGPCNSDPRDLKELHGELLFAATNGSGWQLWHTAGSRQSTAVLATLCAGPVYWQCAYGLVRAGDRMLFAVYSPTSVDLWRSDGTPGGTGPLRDLVPGLPPFQEGPISAGAFAFVWTEDGLWRTDGTAAGTMRLRALSELVTGPEYQRYSFPHSVIWQGMLVSFREMEAMVRSDGTPEGTDRVPGLPRFFDVSRLATLPGGLVFTGDEPASLDALWITRGTLESTEKLLDLGDGPDDSSYIADMVSLGNRVLFRIARSLNEPLELWVTDGTPEGTRRLAGIAGGFYGSQIMSDGTQAYFPSGFISLDLWRTDGTEAGTRRVRNFGAAPGSSGPIAQTVLGDALLFSARTSDLEAPLFRTDGTSAGTRLLSDEASWAQGFTQVGGRVFFGSAILGYTGPAEYYLPTRSVWRTDGTPAGTQEVSESLVAYQPLGTLAGQLLFGGADSYPWYYYGGPDVELWRSDGRDASQLKNINTWDVETGFHHICVPGGSVPKPGLLLGKNRLVFTAEDGRSGRELWVTNGTRAGTRLLADINPSRLPEPPEPDCDDRVKTGVSSDPEGFVPLRNGTVFTADDGKTGRELWWTDGTPEGTWQIRDLRPGKKGSEPHDLTPFQGEVWFIASAKGVGEALWRTDGTFQGTVLVHPLKAGGLPSWARSLTAVGQERLFFSVSNEATGVELWTSRGDTASTRLVADLRRGPQGSYPQNLTNAGGVLVFAATDGETGLEPWRSDGTAAGTVRLGDINPGREASSPGPFSRVGDVVLAGAYDAEHGRELWAIPMEDVLEP